MRVMVALVALFLVVGCGDDEPPEVEVTIVGLPGDGTEIRIASARPGSALGWNVRLKSRSRKRLTFQARLVGEIPPGVTCSLRGVTSLLPMAEDTAKLVFGMPMRVGPIRGRVEISCPEIDWSRQWALVGAIDDVPLEGAYLIAAPLGGIDLGKVKPGTWHPVVVVLRATGSQPITVREWSVTDSKNVRLNKLVGGETIQPGGELQVSLRVRASDAAIGFRRRIRVFSNARNWPKGLDIYVSGRVEADYAARPRKLEAGTVYPMHERTRRIVITAAKGRKPFLIEEVTGHERHFALVSRGGKKPALTQEVILKVLRKAPTDMAQAQRFEIRFRLGPDVKTRVVVPVAMRFVPPIHADPPRVSFGRLESGRAGVVREINLVAFANRKYKVTGIRCVPDSFQAVVDGGAGAPWKITVALRRANPGVYSAKLIITTDDKDVPELRVALYAEIR